MRVKICGATRLDEVELLAAAGVDFVGLWHGVPGGRTELSLAELTRLAAAAHETDRLRPILVTLDSTVDNLVRVVSRSGIEWVQLHGCQQPGAVRGLTAACPNTTVVKVLHIRDGECVERPLIRAYQRAGVDVFLLDTLAADGRIGSTGQTIDPSAAERIAELSERPIMLAGGLTASNSARYRSLTEHPRFFGIDVDSGARDADGQIAARRVAEIRDQWTVVDNR
jgi:phosphoribosylanthranilate isomerase